MNTNSEIEKMEGTPMGNKKSLTAIFNDSQLKGTFTGIILCGALMLAILITAGILMM